MCACVKRPILWSGAFEERKNLAERNISDFENVTYIIFFPLSATVAAMAKLLYTNSLVLILSVSVESEQ